MKMKRVFVLILAVTLCSVASQAALHDYAVSSSDSSVKFLITKWMVFKEEGRFRNVSGTITYNPDDLSSSSVNIIVDTTSLDSGNTTRDEVVRSDDFLDVSRYPQMTFKSRLVESAEDGTLRVSGDLTIRGITRKLAVPVQLLGMANVEEFGDLIAFEAEFTVDRRDFDILGTRWSGGELILSNQVIIRLTIGAVRGPSPLQD